MLSALRLTPFIFCIAAPLFAQSPESLQESWKVLAHKDADVAFAAMRKMAALPREATAFLGRLTIEKADAKVVAGLLQRLNSDRFVDRDKAAAELIRLKDHGYDALVHLAETATDLDTKRRVKALLEEVGEARAAEMRRWVRAVELLEWIATPAAKSLLETWSQEPKSRRAEEAAAALQRWTANESAITYPANASRFDGAGDPLPAGALLRLGTSRWRVDHCRAHVFTADGKHLIVADGHTLKLIDARTGKTTLRRDTDQDITQIELSPDGRSLLIFGGITDAQGRYYPCARLWDANDLKRSAEWARIPGGLFPRAARFARDGKTVLMATGSFIYECEAATGKEIRSQRIPKELSQVVALSETRAVATSLNEDRLLIFNWRDNKHEKWLPAIAERSTGIAFAPDDTLLACRNGNRTGVILYDRTGVREPLHLASQDEAQASVHCFGFSPDGKTLVLANWAHEKSRVIAWDLETQKPRWHASGKAFSIAFSPDSRFVAGNWESRLTIWDLATGKQVSGGGDTDFESTSEIGFVSGQKLWTLAERAVRFWDLPSGRLDAKVAPSGSILLNNVAVSADGERLAATLTENPWRTWDRSLRIWNVATGEEAMRLPASPKISHRNLAFSPDSQRLVSFSDDVLVRTWNLKNGLLLTEHDPTGGGHPIIDEELTLGAFEARERLRGNSGTMSRCLLSRDGACLFQHDNDKIRIFDSVAGKEIAPIADTPKSWNEFKLSADGHWLAAMSYQGEHRGFYVYHLRQKMYHGFIRIRDDLGRPGTFALSPDGRLLAAAAAPNRIHLFETESLTRRFTIALDDSEASQLAFSPGGRFLAVVQVNASVLVYDLRLVP